MAEVRH